MSKTLLPNIIILVIVALVIISGFPVELGLKYSELTNLVLGGSWIGTEDVGAFVIGGAIVWVFLITLLYTAFGKGKRYWWMGILLIPSLLFVILVDLSHIWFYILVGLVGWVLGFGIYKLIDR